MYVNAPGGIALPPGGGLLKIATVAGRSAVVRAQATNPLKILSPRRRGAAAWAYTSTFGGGLVSGDNVQLEVHVGEGASCCLTTQSATKVYKSLHGRSSSQSLRATVSRGGLLVLAPDPTICFSEAVYEQNQRIDIDAGGTLVVVDWVTSGRRECGEQWAFRRYSSRLDVFLAGERVLTEALLLDPLYGSVAAPLRMGRFHCFAVVVTIGERLADVSRRLIEEVAAKSFVPTEPLLESASPVGGGAIVRILGATPQHVGQCLREKLSFTSEFLGAAAWERKW